MTESAATGSGLRQIDHLVLAVHDLARAIEDYRALGFTVTPGGQHPGRTSHNALVVFEDGAYLEIIAWQGPAPQERWWRTLQAHGEGLVDYALLPAHGALPEVLAAAQARGLDTLRGPIDGGRNRPDGERVAWQSARHDTPDVPFLCADLTPRALRVPEGAGRRQANGASGVACVQLAAHDLALTAARHRALLGPAAAPALAGTGRGMACLRYRLDTTDFELFGPVSDLAALGAVAAAAGRAAAPADFDLARSRLDTLGEGPFAFRLDAPADAPARVLDAALTHGARVTLGTLA